MHDAVIARFARTLSTTFAAGVPLPEALESTAGAAGNAVYAMAIRTIRDDYHRHLFRIIDPHYGFVPSMLLQMTGIGEESGSLDDMLGKVADHYEAWVDNAVDSLISLMEPLIMSILAKCVLIAMFAHLYARLVFDGVSRPNMLAMMTAFHSSFFTLTCTALGLVGSFLNVVILRLPK